MKLRKGDVVLLKATIESVTDGRIYASMDDGWLVIREQDIERVLHQHLEPGDMVQGGKVLMLWPEKEPTHVIVEGRDGPPLPVSLNSPVAQRLEDGEDQPAADPDRRVPLFPDPETYHPEALVADGLIHAEVMMTPEMPDEDEVTKFYGEMSR